MNTDDETDSERPRVAVFRPADERLDEALRLLRDLGVEPVGDPLLSIEPTGALPREDADIVVLTSRSGAELVAGAGWDPGGTTLAAIGPKTAGALESAGYPVDIVPETYSSRGLIDALEGIVEGRRVDVSRSDHGNDILPIGLDDLGAYHHETVLYRLIRPPDAGGTTDEVADGAIDAVLFTSSLTVEHFLEAAEERGIHDPVLGGLQETVVGAIGHPTRATAEDHEIPVDVVPDEATIEALATAVVDRLE